MEDTVIVVAGTRKGEIKEVVEAGREDNSLLPGIRRGGQGGCSFVKRRGQDKVVVVVGKERFSCRCGGVGRGGNNSLARVEEEVGKGRAKKSCSQEGRCCWRW